MMNTRNQSSRVETRGFTLIELLVAVAAVGTLASLAYPSYQQVVQKSRRAEAKVALLDLAARQERYFSMNNTYASTPDALGYSGKEFPVDVAFGGQAHYRLSVSLGDTANGFSASASPTGGQVRDRCGTYTLNHLGMEGNLADAEPSKECW